MEVMIGITNFNVRLKGTSFTLEIRSPREEMCLGKVPEPSPGFVTQASSLRRLFVGSKVFYTGRYYKIIFV